MSSAASISFHHRKTFLALAAALLLTALLALLFAPSARADSPVLTVSSGTTNPGGTVMITGSGWAPAQTYSLYVYSQKSCNGQTTCPPPAGKTPISTQIPINKDGTLREFDFQFISGAATITYVITAVADYPAGNPYMASVPVQVTPPSTPPSGTPVSSSPAATTPTTGPTKAATTTTATKTSQAGGTTTGDQTTTTSTGGGTTNLLIVVVLILLLLMIGVLVVLLRILPPKRRAIRAAYYGSGPAATPGRVTGGQRRQPSGAYYRSDEQMPWQGGVASWGDDEPRTPRGSRPVPRSPRRPGDNSGPRW